MSANAYSALTKKYGAPTHEKFSMVWNYSNNSNSATEKDCIVAIKRAVNHPSSFRYSYGRLMGTLMRRLNSTCGLVLTANIPSDSDKIIQSMVVGLADFSEIRRQKSATDDYIRQLNEERHQDELKKASQGSAPTL